MSEQRLTSGERHLRTFHVTLEIDEDGWFVARCPALSGCVSQGRTEQEATVTIKEAVEAWMWAETHKPMHALSSRSGDPRAAARKSRAPAQTVITSFSFTLNISSSTLICPSVSC